MSRSTSTNSKILPLLVDCTIIQHSLSYGKFTHYFRSPTRPIKTFLVCGPACGELRATRAGPDERLLRYDAWPKSDVRLIRGEIRTDEKLVAQGRATYRPCCGSL